MFAFVLSWKEREMREAADQRPIERKMMRMCYTYMYLVAGASAEMTSILRGKITNKCACGVKNFARAKEKQSQHITCFLALHVRRLQKRTVEFNATNARNSGNCMLIDTNSLLQTLCRTKIPRLGLHSRHEF